MVEDRLELARKARALLRRAPVGVLSTVSAALPGFPFGSVVTFALTHEARPLLYTSRLAEHTRNLAADPRACLTVRELEAGGDAQALARVSLLVEAHQLPEVDHARAAARYFALFPEQRAYEELGDFAFWLLEPVRARWIGGFGEIAWIEPEAWRVPAPAWATAEAEIVRHMNEDHRDALAAMCAARLGETPRDVAMLACDPEGFHVRHDGRVAWIAFARTCETAEAVRAEMVRLAREARAG